MDSNRLTMSGRLEYGLELLPLVGLLGELYTEILADKGAVPLVQPGDLFPFLYLQLT